MVCSSRLELGEQQASLLLFELPGVEGGSLKAWVKVVLPLKVSSGQPAERDEAAAIRIRIARDELADARAKLAVGRINQLEFAGAEHKLAVAEAHGDAVAVARANLKFADISLAAARNRFVAGLIPQAEMRTAEGQRAIAEIELKAALKNAPPPPQ